MIQEQSDKLNQVPAQSADQVSRWTIRRKLTAIIMCTSLTVLILAGGILVLWDRHVQRQNMIRDLEIQAEISAENCTAAVQFQDAEGAQETLRAFRVKSSIEYVCVLDQTGKILADFKSDTEYQNNQEEHIKKCKLSASDLERLAVEEHYFDNKYLILSKEIRLEGEAIGRIIFYSNP